MSLKDVCNKQDQKKHSYFLLEEFLTPKVLFRALKLYFEVYLQGLRLKEAQKAFCVPGSKMNFFPSLKNAWKVSLFGHLAMDGALQITLFDAMAKTLPASPWGLYTWEGSSWESALISAWRKHGENSKILGSQHGFSRRFDLRQFSCPGELDNGGEDAKILPDKLCVTSKEGWSLIRESGVPEEKIAEAEALRYMSLKGCYHIYKKQTPSKERVLL